MNIVVDTSALLAVLLEESEREQILEITCDAELLAPVSLHWEMGNALSAMFKKGRIRLKDAHFVIKAYQQIPLQLCEVDLAKSLEIAEHLKIYAYDAYMLECARAHKAPLLTLDTVLKDNALKRKIEIVEVGK